MGVVDKGRELGGSRKVIALILMPLVEHRRGRRKDRKIGIPIRLGEWAKIVSLEDGAYPEILATKVTF